MVDGDPGRLLARILDTPQLAHALPHLQPEILHRVIQRCGLEDCGALIAIATPAQLSAVLDLDLWRSSQPGVDEQFDADRFGIWLELLLESGATVAARTLAAIDAGVVMAAFAQYVRVFDPAAVVLSPSRDDDDVVSTTPNADFSCDIGGYRVVARRHDAWDATVAILNGLDADHHDYFHRVMKGCRSLSNSSREVDGLDHLLTEADQVMFDRAVERERRRERQGYVTPAQAGAFLQMSRTLPRGRDSTPPPGNPIASAYFRAIDWTGEPDVNSESGGEATSGTSPTERDPAAAAAAVVDVLVDAGVLPHRPRALLEGAQGRPPRLARIQARLEFARERDEATYSLRNQELGYLANVLVAGCSIQARPFTTQEAFEAAFAVCNLGLENWPPHWLAAQSTGGAVTDAGTELPNDFLVHQDLVGVFQVGWTILHEDVCAFAAARLIAVLRGLRCDDRELQAELKGLVRDLTRQSHAGVPWRARESFDVMAILDMTAWAALLGLIDECPTIHAGLAASGASRVRSVSSTAFEFVSENSQIVSVRAFMASLPERLRP